MAEIERELEYEEGLHDPEAATQSSRNDMYIPICWLDIIVFVKINSTNNFNYWLDTTTTCVPIEDLP